MEGNSRGKQNHHFFGSSTLPYSVCLEREQGCGTRGDNNDLFLKLYFEGECLGISLGLC